MPKSMPLISIDESDMLEPCISIAPSEACPDRNLRAAVLARALADATKDVSNLRRLDPQVGWKEQALCWIYSDETSSDDEIGRAHV